MIKALTVAVKDSTLTSITDYLQSIFEGYIVFDKIIADKIESADKNKYEYYVCSGPYCYERLINHIGTENNCRLCQRAIDLRNFRQILSIPPDSKIYLVNDSVYDAEDTVKQLCDLLPNQYSFIPWYPGCDYTIKKDDFVVTVGERQLVPPQVENIYDIGSRIVDLPTIYDIITDLSLPLQIANQVILEQNKHIMRLFRQSTSQIKNIFKSKSITKTIMDNVDLGICLVSSDGRISMVNKAFRVMLGINRTIIDVELCILFNELNISLDELIRKKYLVVSRGKENLIINMEDVAQSDGSFLLMVNYAQKIIDNEIAIRKEDSSRKKKKYYTIDDYISRDERVLSLLEKIKMISKNDGNILIEGESGTGKEIIAQAIHSASMRKNRPFVAVNFAAMQENLLESELFGYEDGAFTGAKKGGKKGLFELAHKGTIFLDEIGDAPINFQTKLLRVLQEKEVRHLGGYENIPIDVRVIVATNKDLYQLVKDHKFRADLFYRISILPIHTIPLRNRRGDVAYLFSHFLKEKFNSSGIDIHNMFSDELIRYLESYPWPGNVRELVNLCEYFSCIYTGTRKFDVDDLPAYFFAEEDTGNVQSSEKAILSIIEANPHIGRKGICTKMNEAGFNLSESVIRSIEKDLADDGYILVHKTRGGCEITSKGKRCIQE